MAQQLWFIENGPGKWDFAMSLFEGRSGESNSRKAVVFVINTREDGLGDQEIVEVTIEGAEREDGSGEKWNFEAFVVMCPGPRHIWFSGQRLQGFFDLKKRQGVLESKK